MSSCNSAQGESGTPRTAVIVGTSLEERYEICQKRKISLSLKYLSGVVIEPVKSSIDVKKYSGSDIKF